VGWWRFLFSSVLLVEVDVHCWVGCGLGYVRAGSPCFFGETYQVNDLLALLCGLNHFVPSRAPDNNRNHGCSLPLLVPL
jgi:hypothetical protein